MPDTSGLALDLAMEEARSDPSLREHVAAFLTDQRGLIADQRHHMREQFGPQLRQLHLGVWEKRVGVFLRAATAMIGLALATGAGLMVWDAAHSKGLIIEPFSVPPSLVERGLSGEVVASRMIDRLTAMTKSESSRAVQSYANNWGDNIKVEIPETGVSIGELRRFLKNWLGQDIRISGEVTRTGDGIAVTARTSGEAGATFTGKEEDLGALVQQAAEHVYEVTQPYRYANYLDRNFDPQGLEQRVAKANAIYRRLIAGDDPVERAWAWNGLGTNEFRYHLNDRLSAEYYRKSLAETPDFTIGYFALAARYLVLNNTEKTLANYRVASRLLHRDTVPGLNPHFLRYARLNTDSYIAGLVGDYGAMVALNKAGAELPDDFSAVQRGPFRAGAIIGMAQQHDLAAVRAYLREIGWSETDPYPGRNAVYAEREDWRALIETNGPAVGQLIQFRGSSEKARLARASYNNPQIALAKARLGDFAGAEVLMAQVPGDNDRGLLARALIAELRGQRARADWWFARLQAQAPSWPFSYYEWGRVLLKRGQPDAAIAQFNIANQKGPHFADPIECWGEALMAKGQSHRALEKFAEAEKYAPNWGRLHLKWGQALAYSGNKEDAAKHFARAAQLDLTPSEKAELARQR